LLKAEGLVAGYGRMRIIDNVSLSLATGEVVGVIGHNGMGKTTLLRTLVGQLAARSGQVWLAGRDITRDPPASRVRLGLGYVPQGRQIFPDLTVMENLRMGEAARTEASQIPAMLERFKGLSALLNRSGRALSGGEQQLLALARCLLARPKVVLLDEPSEGIQPSIVDQIAGHLQELASTHKVAIVLVEQDLQLVARIAHRALVMRKGRVVAEMPAADVTRPSMIEDLLGI
jgi:branched-chain amino acid transport system ATP-binding protein